MSDERRYGDEEVREILDLAANVPGSGGQALSSGEGLTLAELKEIGAEVGIDPQRITDAASALEHRPAVLPRGTNLGMPISVGRVVELPRAPTDEEWGLLVGELRATFGARGKLTEHGSLREWRNSNLHASVEPTESGYRLRMGTLKGSARSFNALGIGFLALSAVMFVVFSLTGELGAEAAMLVLWASMGLGGLAFNALTLPGWAKEREEQMEYIASRARALIGPPADE